MDITAEVTTKHGLLTATIKEQDRDHLTRMVCEGRCYSL